MILELASTRRGKWHIMHSWALCHIAVDAPRTSKDVLVAWDEGDEFVTVKPNGFYVDPSDVCWFCLTNLKQRIPCPPCRGSGIALTGKACHRCLGTGRRPGAP